MDRIIPEQRIETCGDCLKFMECQEHEGHGYYAPPDNCPLPVAPEWKDKPDSEGWWWFYGEYFTLSGIKKTDKVEILFIETEDLPVTIGTDGYNGKWQKATLPPLPEEEK